MPEILHDLVQTNGIDLHVAMQGSGPFVIFCHGFPGHWSNWKHQLQAVANAGYTGVAVDMRGYGESSRPARVADYSMNEQVADMCGLLDALDREKAIFIFIGFLPRVDWLCL